MRCELIFSIFRLVSAAVIFSALGRGSWARSLDHPNRTQFCRLLTMLQHFFFAALLPIRIVEKIKQKLPGLLKNMRVNSVINLFVFWPNP